MTTIPVQVDRSASLRTVDDLMKRYDIRHIPVTENEKLIGVVCESDIRAISAIKEIDFDSQNVGLILTYKPYSVSPDMLVSEVAKQMLKEKFSCTVVVDKGKVTGIFTESDALKMLIDLFGG